MTNITFKRSSNLYDDDDDDSHSSSRSSNDYESNDDNTSLETITDRSRLLKGQSPDYTNGDVVADVDDNFSDDIVDKGK